MLGTLIVSPLASRIRDPEARHQLTGQATAAMLDRGVTRVELHEAGEPAAIRAAGEAAVAAGAGLVVMAGGDGTVRDASSALAGTAIPVAILPCGTGNLYATAAGIPRDLRHAVRLIRDGVPVAHDIGRVRLTASDGATVLDSGFVVACGTGLDARLIAATSRESRRRYGVAAYFLAASKLLDHLSPNPTVLEVDDAAGRAHLGRGAGGELRRGDPRPAPSAPADPRRRRAAPRVRAPARRDRGRHPRRAGADGRRGRGPSASGFGIRLTGTRVRVSVTPSGPTQVDGDAYGPATLDASAPPRRAPGPPPVTAAAGRQARASIAGAR